jgi:hypothetical protein
MNNIHLDEVVEGNDLRLLDVTSKICELMDSQGISKADLSRTLGTSKGYVTQMLDGSRNLTLRTLSDVFLALNKQACIRTRDFNLMGRPVELHLAQEPMWEQPKRSWLTENENTFLVDYDGKTVA